MIAYGLDVSNYQSADLSDLIAQHDPSFVMVHLPLPWERIDPDYVREQIASIRTNGRNVGGYGWAFRSADPAGTIAALLDFCASVELVLPILWLDCETAGNDPGPDAFWLRTALAAAASLQTPVGLYTAGWYINGVFPGGMDAFREFADVPLLVAQYNGAPHPDDVQGFDGFRVVGKQWITDPDRDAIYAEYTQVAAPPPPPPPVDPCSDLRAAVRARLGKRVTRKWLAEVGA